MTGARKFGVIIFGAILIVLFAGIAIAQGVGKPSVPKDDVALVEDVPGGLGHVSQEGFDRSFKQISLQAGLQAPPKEDDAQYSEIRDAAMNDLLDQAWLTGEADELGTKASSREIDAEMATIRQDEFQDQAEFDQFLKDSGFTKDEIRDRVRLQVLSTKIETEIVESVGSVDEKEVEDFYEASKESFTTPATRDILLIVTDSEKKADAASEALGDSPDDKTFAKVAKEFSVHTSKSEGGETVATEGAFPDPAGTDIMTATEDTVVGPVKGDDQFYIFKVTEATDETVQPLDEVREQIEQQLLPTLQQAAMTDFVASYNSKWTSRTVCAEDFLISRCGNYSGDDRLEMADPACYQGGAGKNADLICPAPVALAAPQAPGANAVATGLGQSAPALPQGAITSGDSTKPDEDGAGAMGGLDLGGAAGGDPAAQAAAQAAAAQAAQQAGGE